LSVVFIDVSCWVFHAAPGPNTAARFLTKYGQALIRKATG